MSGVSSQTCGISFAFESDSESLFVIIFKVIFIGKNSVVWDKKRRKEKTM